MAETKYITWQAYEHEHVERSPDWFWGLGIIAVAGAAVAAIFGNILFAILILLGAFTLALVAAKPPAFREFALTERGLRIDDTLYPFRNLQAFWIVDEDGPGGKPAQLRILSNHAFAPLLVIPLAEDTLIDDVHAFLERKLPEEPLEESFPQKLMEIFGF